MLDACLYTDLKETKDNRHALFFVPDTKYMEFLLDVDEFSMLYSSTPRRESCLWRSGLGPVFGTGKMYLCPLSSLDKSMSTARFIHTSCSSGHKAIAVQENFWGCSGPHLKTYIEACVLSEVCLLCVLCRQCLPWDYMVYWAVLYTAFSPIYRTLSATRWMHKSMITTAHKPFLMHSRILLRATSNHTSLPPRLHPGSGLQRA